MKRISAVILLLLISVWAMAQGTQSSTTPSSANTGAAANTGTSSNTGGSTPAAQAVTPSTIIITGQNGLSTNTGTAVILAPPSAPVMVTPEFHLAPAVTTVGASNATAGNTAGAVNATAELPQPPRIITTVPQFATAGVAVTETVPPQENTGAPVTSGAGTTSGTSVVLVNNPSTLNLGVGSLSGLTATGNTGGKSLGQIAREYRQRDAGMNAHVYTNQDIERINQQPSLTVGGTSGAAVGTGATTQPQPFGNKMPAVSQPSANPAPTNPGVSQPVPPTEATPPASTPPPQQGRAVAPSAQEPARGNETGEMAETHYPGTAAGQPQVSPSAAENQAATPQRQTLPGGGSILPLMAIVGFLATGAGLLAK